eukprot:CAMPEP_0202965596 /NCGR_PEP_ID=MMETSP1396-20130829/9516_1 /ASSEMBLY_ACC=CAM_ASM_000872 /TAXON_ID= /ORGANISM="Pseudokeronopsis sp., Strain Brazil" /LENGTH=127 /DNA_ID=CAMNT_0049688359 /DNA_START=326 /DNA_END=709 /DNA_ORIENTATION=-
MGHIIGCSGDSYMVPLYDPSINESIAHLNISPSSVLESNWEAHLKISATYTADPGCCGCLCIEQNNPYFVIERAGLDGENKFVEVYRSEQQHNTHEPKFPFVKINGGALAKGKDSLVLKFKLMNFNG